MANVHDVRNEPDPQHVAARLRALLEPALHSTGLTAVAARLGVSSKLVRLSIEFRDPQRRRPARVPIGSSTSVIKTAGARIKRSMLVSPRLLPRH